MKKIIIIILAITLPLISVKAQKFVKHKYGDKTQTWYSIKYPTGEVGISVNNKKNIIADKTHGYNSVSYDYFNTKTFIVKKGGFEGVLDRTGKVIVTCNKYCRIDGESKYVYPEHIYFYKVSVGKDRYSVDSVGILDYEGNVVLPSLYKSIKLDSKTIYADGKSTEVLWFKATKEEEGKEYKEIYATDGTLLFSTSDYDWVDLCLSDYCKTAELSDNIIGYRVSKNKKSGVCDKDGNEVLAPAYESVSITDRQNGTLLIEFKQNSKVGVADFHGNIIIFPKYEKVMAYSSDPFFYVELNGKHGICDASGVEIIPPVLNNRPIWSQGQFKIKEGQNFVAINLEKFKNPAQKIKIDGDKKVLADANGTFSIRAYDVLVWSENLGKYVASLYGYTTTIDQLGKEDNSIAKQIFEEAYNLPDDNIYEQIALYNLLIEVDGNNKEGYQALALNNIGVMYQNNGDEDTALKFYDKASAMGSSRASSNAAQIRKARKAAARAERMQRLSETLGQINNALSSYSSTSEYNSYSNSNYYQQQTTGSSGNGGNATARQSAYNHMANRAASLYSKLKDKNGYVGSASTHSVDVSTYNSLQSKMRNYRISAQRDGITLQKSQYEDLSL